MVVAMGRHLHWSYLGSVGYSEAVRLQQELRAGVRQGGPHTLLLLEHPHVFTLGRNASRSHLTADADWLTRRGVEVHECDRGGQITYHGPGQLVGYPVIDLDPGRRDLRRFVRDLQEVLVRTLAELGIAAVARTEQPEIGVWVGHRKIASLGVHVSHWITTHGFALNVSTDLSFFDGIVACGIDGVEMASVESLTGLRPAMAEVAALCARCFCEVFDYEPVPEERSCLVPS